MFWCVESLSIFTRYLYFLLPLRAPQNAAQLVKILSDTTKLTRYIQYTVS